MTREEAIKIVRNIYQTDAEKEALGTLVPELAESENKKISNLIYCIVRDREDVKNTLEANGVSVNDALAYLEKQKDSKVVKFDHDREQKPAKKQDYSGLNDLERVIHRGFLCAGVENVPVGIIKETAQECLTQMQSAEWSEEDKEMLSSVEQWLHEEEPHYVEKELSWLESLPERFNLQPKQEWSEEDEKMYNIFRSMVHGIYVVQTQEMIDSLLSWLKSLRPRPQWKPSEEQMRVFLKATPVNLMPEELSIYKSLCNDIQKLM